MPRLCRNGHDKDVVGSFERDGGCKECERVRQRRYNKSPKGSAMYHAKQIRRHYGISPEQYQEMFIRQGGKCGICGKHQSQLKRRLSVDHDHFTGAVRGLLCIPCNSSLGWHERYGDKAAGYLGRANA